MTPKNSCTPLDLQYLKNNLDILPREYLYFCEYRRLETDCLRQNCVAQLQKRVGGEKNFSLSVTRGGALKAFMLFEYLPYDSEIFEFNVYRISDYCFIGRDDLENQHILETMLFNLQEKREELNIKYITFSLNANIPTSTLLVNCLMKNKFYYIDSLIVFKMQKHDYKDIVLPKKHPAEITTRMATVEDEAAIFELAKKSYKIDRFHLDKHLSREKCDKFTPIPLKTQFRAGSQMRLLSRNTRVRSLAITAQKRVTIQFSTLGMGSVFCLLWPKK